MTGNEILQADMLDILFDNRNKDYGAYRLRKFYSNRLILSLAIALTSVFLLFFLFNTRGSKSFALEARDQVILKKVVVPQEKKKIEIVQPKKTIASPASAAPQRKFIDRIEIRPDDKVTDKMPDNKSLTDVTISDIDHVGVPGGPKVPGVVNIIGAGGGEPSAKTTNDAPLISREPEFPGGVQAWLRFLNKNLRVPDDLEAGEKKTVLIRFEVAIDGTVTGFEVVQTGGKIYDEEVIRVLKKMPKWKPALQSNQPVAVAFTQPVTFMGIGE